MIAIGDGFYATVSGQILSGPLLGRSLITRDTLTDIKRAEHEARARHNLESLGVLAGGIGGCRRVSALADLAKDLREEGMPREQATLEASRLRLRPILMTSFAFILGVVPLVIATGAGAEMRRALGTAVFAAVTSVNPTGSKS
jgi:hypothetical protein